MSNTEELVRKLEAASQQVARLQGQEYQAKARLKEEFGVSSIREAKALLEEMKIKHEKAEKQIDKQADELERALDEVGL